MTTLRENPDDGLLDVLHADSNTWVRAVALLQVAGGLNAALTPTQFSVLQQILSNTELLTEMSTRVQNTAIASGNTADNTQILYEKLVGDTNPNLVATLNQLTEMGLQDLQLFNKVQEILTFMNNSQNYTTRLQAIQNQLESLTLITNGLDSRVGDNTFALQAFKTQEDAARPSTPTFKQVSITSSNIQYSVAVDATTRLLRMRCRPAVGSGTTTRIRYSWSSGEVTNTASGNFSTLTGTEVLELREVKLAGTLYLAGEAGSNVVEVELYR
jgi:hypothetical protein